MLRKKDVRIQVAKLDKGESKRKNTKGSGMVKAKCNKGQQIKE